MMLKKLYLFNLKHFINFFDFILKSFLKDQLD